ncbi:2-isopropylmalate synthase [Melia azedarach]|uniref:2-isopropylmalate synthase n=1 Tax=Melia azedarach TaxID=155640 RepID=A0ACC1X4U3_MELAZ|nr:2-isopropylmalate synthase [Melia azedarach]
MASAVVNKDCSENIELSNKAFLAADMDAQDHHHQEEEEEEELFEIDLEAVESIPPPHYWESYFTAATSSTLLANCLLPISDVSSAIPMASSANCSLFIVAAESSVEIFSRKISWDSLFGDRITQGNESINRITDHNEYC